MIGTPWEAPGPCIIDVDQGKVYELEHYHAIVKVRHIMEAPSETTQHRQLALEAQNRLAEIENSLQSNNSIVVPTFLQKILHGRQYQQLQRKNSPYVNT